MLQQLLADQFNVTYIRSRGIFLFTTSSSLKVVLSSKKLVNPASSTQEWAS